MSAPLPSLNGLRAFEAAARLLSFTHAAAELNVTQTAISHQIRRLEDQLGIRLFVRRDRALSLTPEAQAYLPAVRTAFEDLRRATARLRRTNRDGVLTVSTMPSLAAKWLLARVGRFQDLHPGIAVHITTSWRFVDFERGEADMAIRWGRGNWPGLRTDWLMSDEIFPVCSPALLNGRKPLRHLNDLGNHTLLHNDGWPEDWRLWLTSVGLPPALADGRGLNFDDSVMTLQAAIEGLGVALGWSRVVEADIAAGRLVAPFDTVLPAEAGYYVVAPEATADAPLIALFRDWLIASVQPGKPASLAR